MYEFIEVGGSKTEPAKKFLRRENLDETFSWIPEDESNIDYQAYLAWKAEQ